MEPREGGGGGETSGRGRAIPYGGRVTWGGGCMSPCAGVVKLYVNTRSPVSVNVQ